jgi:hypothetical protein
VKENRPRPIPGPSYDWAARLDGEEEQSTCNGRTASEALTFLMDILSGREPEQGPTISEAYQPTREGGIV